MTSISAPRLHRTTFGRTAAATAVGTAMEMYDFVLYGTAASLVFNKIFFPSQDPVMGTLAALGTFGVGFLARPIGGVVFGHLGDRIGRKTVLVITMLAMGLLSTFIGLLPTYAAIGVAAPTLLVVLRLLQGVAMGGEQGGAFVMAAEAGSRKRGFLASWPAVGMTGGLVLATLIFGIFSRLPEDQFMNWGWRVPFLLSLVLVGVGIAVRLGVPESQTFEKIQERKEVAKAPLAEAVRTYWKQILQVIGMKTGETAAFFFLATFSITYGVQFIHLDRTLMLNAVLVGALAEMIAAPLWGLLSDRVGRRPVMMFGAGFLIVFAAPFFLLLNSGQAPLIYIALISAMGIGHGAIASPAGAFFAEIFPTRVRLSGVSLGIQLTSALAGGFTPLIATALMASYHSYVPIAIYIAVLAAVSLLSALFTAETYKLSALPE